VVLPDPVAPPVPVELPDPVLPEPDDPLVPEDPAEPVEPDEPLEPAEPLAPEPIEPLPLEPLLPLLPVLPLAPLLPDLLPFCLLLFLLEPAVPLFELSVVWPLACEPEVDWPDDPLDWAPALSDRAIAAATVVPSSVFNN